MSQSDEIEQIVLDLCAEVLGRTGLSGEDDFFALGGDSLHAMHVIARLNELTGVRVRVRTLFEHSGLSAFAQEVNQLRAGPARDRSGSAGPVHDVVGPDPIAAMKAVLEETQTQAAGGDGT